MAKECKLTGKTKSFGHQKKHKRGSSGGGGVWRYKAPKTKRTWEPNFRKAKVVNPDGKQEKIIVSMKAYKKLRQDNSFRGYKLVESWKKDAN